MRKTIAIVGAGLGGLHRIAAVVLHGTMLDRAALDKLMADAARQAEGS